MKNQKNDAKDLGYRWNDSQPSSLPPSLPPLAVNITAVITARDEDKDREQPGAISYVGLLGYLRVSVAFGADDRSAHAACALCS